MDYDAAIPIEDEVLDDLLERGHALLPTQWVDTDKNAHLGEGHDAEFKSRLVACGQFENCPEVRTDSPTCDVEGLNMLCSWAACNSLHIQCADIKNAYFNADPTDRLMLLRAPKGGISRITARQRACSKQADLRNFRCRKKVLSHAQARGSETRIQGAQDYEVTLRVPQ